MLPGVAPDPRLTDAAAVLGAVKARPGNTEIALPAECRPTLTAPARDGVRNLRSGRKKVCGAVEQKKTLKKQDTRRCARWALKTEPRARTRRSGRRNGRQARTFAPRG